MTNSIFVKHLSIAKVKRLCTDRKIFHVHVKYQRSSTYCLKVSGKVNAWHINRMTERWNDRMTDSCKYIFHSYTEKTSLSSKSFSDSLIKKTTLSSWQIYVQKSLSKKVCGWEKRRQNLCRNCVNLHDTNHFFTSNIASKPWQMNVQ